MTSSPDLKYIKNMLVDQTGYLPQLLRRLNELTSQIEKKDTTDHFLLAKILYFAEMVNNEIDAYTSNLLTNPDITGLREWRQSEEFQSAWKIRKRERDVLYGRLVNSIPKERLDETRKLVKWYGDYLLRFLEPTPPIPTPPKHFHAE